MSTKWNWKRKLYMSHLKARAIKEICMMVSVGAMDTLDEDGLGVYVEPIVNLARKYASFWKVKNLTGKEPEALYAAIEAGNPVWVLTNARLRNWRILSLYMENRRRRINASDVSPT